VQLGKLPKSNGASQPNGNGSEWEPVSGLEALAHAAVQIIEVSGHPVLFCRLDEKLYAYSHICAGCGQTLQGARVEAAALVCPTCGQRYEVARAGRGLDQPSLHLEPFPRLIEEGQAKIARPVLLN
jgi:nitrite reductase/ring-hydroxylating ferredoxin subunit